MNIRNRIVEMRKVPAKDLKPHPLNWRNHPEKQRLAFRAVLNEIGFAGVELVYRSERNGGALTLIDGHMRHEEVGDFELPCAITDLDDAEADKLLAVTNPLAEMAEPNAEKLEQLLAEISTDEAAIDELLEELAAENGLVEAEEKPVKEIQVKPPPKMAWVLIGIPVVRFADVSALVEKIADVPGSVVESTVNDG